MKDKPGVRVIACKLQQELTSRFEKVLNPSSGSFDPIYIEATLLDPKYKILLNRHQEEAAKAQLLLDVSFRL